MTRSLLDSSIEMDFFLITPVNFYLQQMLFVKVMSKNVTEIVVTIIFEHSLLLYPIHLTQIWAFSDYKILNHRHLLESNKHLKKTIGTKTLSLCEHIWCEHYTLELIPLHTISSNFEIRVRLLL